jgi:hypothetical protein
MFNPTLIQENGGPHSSGVTENRGLTQAQASRHLSPTIGTKQKYSNGQPDGKIEVVPRESERFHAIITAGDNRVGVNIAYI